MPSRAGARTRWYRSVPPLVAALLAAVTASGTSTPASAAAVTATQTCNNVLQTQPDNTTIYGFEACVTVTFTADQWRPGYSYANAAVTVRRDVAPTGSPDVQITLSDVLVYHGWNTANSGWEVVARPGFPIAGNNSVSWSQSTSSSYSNTAGHAFRGCVKWRTVTLGEQITCTKPATLT